MSCPPTDGSDTLHEVNVGGRRALCIAGAHAFREVRHLILQGEEGRRRGKGTLGREICTQERKPV